MKTVKISIEMIYDVPDDKVEEVAEHDMKFFQSIRDSFYAWGDKKDEPRRPIDFDLQVLTGDTNEEE